MTHVFTEDQWQHLGGHFNLNVRFNIPFDKPIVQIYKYGDSERTAAFLVLPNQLTVILNNGILIQVKEPFDGYLVIK